MRTEAEIRAAAEAMAWLWSSGAGTRYDDASQNTLVGVTAAVEWALGGSLGGDSNPVTALLREISRMRADPGRN